MDTRVRLQVDLRSHPGDVYILIEPLRIPSEEQYRNGVSVVTKPLVRENPKAKQTSFIRLAEAERHQLAPGIFEEVMLDSKSRMLEGLSSNFFVIVRGEIWTAEAGVLSGVTRSIILEEADRLEYPARLEGYPSDRLSEIQEAFLSSSSRGVVPVVSINGEPVGKRIPGPITQAITEAYNNRVKTDVVEIKPI